MNQGDLLLLTIAVWLLPLVGFVLLVFFNKRLPRQGDIIETGILGLGLAASLVILFAKLFSFPDAVISTSFTWVDFGNVPGVGHLPIKLGFMLDNLAAMMMVVVTVVSFLVHLFSIGYMKDDVRYGRYFAFLGLFTFSMLGIVISNNFFLTYVSWELVGLSSYLLIGHWYEKRSASNAGKKAFLVTRVGDIGMFIGILILYVNFHSFLFDDIFGAIAAGKLPYGSGGWLTAAGILVFIGAIGKSAQFPLHVWLPDAMEGPTPVSALIHAATMVAAGVYLVARLFAMFTADALLVIAYIGAVTAFIAATIAVAQNDIKKVLAYSTISQLGYMMLGLGVGAYTAGFFHLMTHAWFKAGLFLGSGSVIHAMQHALRHAGDHETDPQDIRNMGGLKKKMPLTYWTFVMFTLTISGVPLTSGFLSKDEVLAGSLAFGSLSGHWLLPLIGFGVAGLTAFYMFRLVILTFHGDHRVPHRLEHIHESPRVMTLPLVILAVISLFFFYSWNPFGASSGWVYRALPPPQSIVPVSQQPASLVAAGAEEHVAPSVVMAETMHRVHGTTMLLSLLVAGLGILVAFLAYQWRKLNPESVKQKIGPVYTFILNKWYFDELYQATFVAGTLKLANLFKWFDLTVIDGVVNGTASITRLFSWFSGRFDNIVVDGMVNGAGYVTGLLGLVFKKTQTGKVQTYLVFAVLGVVILFFVFR